MSRRGIIGQLLNNNSVKSLVGFPYSATYFNLTFLNRLGALTGLADGKTGLCSFWIKLATGSEASQAIIGNNTTHFYISCRGDYTIQVRAQNAAGVEILNFQTVFTSTLDDWLWHHVACFWDLANNNAFIFLDGTDVSLNTTTTNDTIDYLDNASPNILIGHQAGQNELNACLSEFWFNTEYLDLTITSNLQKFRSAGGKPVNLGSNGSTPTGNQPLIYLPNPFGTIQNNAGSGGNFTLDGSTGTPVACGDTE
jgi:hypothetical protein